MQIRQHPNECIVADLKMEYQNLTDENEGKTVLM